MAEVRRKDLPAGFFQIPNVGIEVVGVSVEVPNPGCGVWSLSEAFREKSGLFEFFEVGWNVVPVDWLIVNRLRFFPTLWWADGHREVPRGTGSRWRATPSTGPRACRGPGDTTTEVVLIPGASTSRKSKLRLTLELWAPTRGPLREA